VANRGYPDNRYPIPRSAAADACKEILMKKALTAVLAVATVAVSLATFATEASAGRRGGLAAGLAIGAVGGLIAGTAIANSRPAYVVEPVPVYVAPRYCIVDQQIWSNRYQAWVIRPTRVPC